MSPFSIALLAGGALIFIISYFIPDKKEEKSKDEIEDEKQLIRELMEKELDSMKLRVNEAANESVSYGMEQCERELAKISNEKILAVNECGTAVLGEIERNHKEVMFLYDMLNDKQTDIKNTVRKAEVVKQEVIEGTKAAEIKVEKPAEPVSQMGNAVTVNEPVYFSGKIDESIFEKMERNDVTPVISNTDSSEISSDNSNDMILKLYDEGMETVDIARELNLGIGEVKLVIDLFR